MVSVQYVSTPDRFRSGIREILLSVDDEFVPPLTGDSRDSVTRTGAEGGQTDIEGYVQRCVERPLVGAIEDGTLVGLLSFEQIDDAPLIEPLTPTNHVEIVAVRPEYRGQGLATEMYCYILKELPSEVSRPYVSTKTWDSNTAHLEILDRLGFELVHREADDRGPGIDTVYYARSV